MGKLRLVVEVPDSVLGTIKTLRKLGVNWSDDVAAEIERLVEQKKEVYLNTMAVSMGIEREGVARSSAPGTPVLSEDAVRAIRNEAAGGIGYGELASRWGVSKSCVQKIVTRRTWKHVV